jgi:hypothetical protein
MFREAAIMPVSSALRKQPGALEKSEPRLYHAKMLVTRLEEWCVEAATAEEARALFAAGGGHRCTPGESVHTEFDELIDE